MSYNCTNWKTKKLDTLLICVEDLYMHDCKDWHPTRNILVNGQTKFTICEESYLVGDVEFEVLSVKEIVIRGEGSGTAYDWIIKPALQKSRGVFRAVAIWEGGDSITRINVNDGVFTEEEVEL